MHSLSRCQMYVVQCLCVTSTKDKGYFRWLNQKRAQTRGIAGAAHFLFEEIEVPAMGRIGA